MLLIMIAVELMLGYLVGLVTQLNTDEDYAAWRRLKEVTKLVTHLEEAVTALLSSIEIAKKSCAAGILRAQVTTSRRRIPYYRSLSALLVFAILSSAAARAQKVERYEGILIDTSRSISNSGATNELFRQYLISTKKLLATEPAGTRVWVSTIAIDSFGGDGTLLGRS